jgi:acyl carrier protein
MSEMGETTAVMLESMADILGVETEDLRDDTQLYNLQCWDSVNALRVLSRIEKQFGVRLDMSRYMTSASVSDLMGLVREAKKNG